MNVASSWIFSLAGFVHMKHRCFTNHLYIKSEITQVGLKTITFFELGCFPSSVLWEENWLQKVIPDTVPGFPNPVASGNPSVAQSIFWYRGSRGRRSHTFARVSSRALPHFTQERGEDLATDSFGKRHGKMKPRWASCRPCSHELETWQGLSLKGLAWGQHHVGLLVLRRCAGVGRGQVAHCFIWWHLYLPPKSSAVSRRQSRRQRGLGCFQDQWTWGWRGRPLLEDLPPGPSVSQSNVSSFKQATPFHLTTGPRLAKVVGTGNICALEEKLLPLTTGMWTCICYILRA